MRRSQSTDGVAFPLALNHEPHERALGAELPFIVVLNLSRREAPHASLTAVAAAFVWIGWLAANFFSVIWLRRTFGVRVFRDPIFLLGFAPRRPGS